MKDEDVIFERILKWTMFALLAFITRGGIFILYCAYHIMTGHQELEENHRSRPLTQDELVELNKPENLTEEDKQYFYKHPFAYKDKNGEYKEIDDAYWYKSLRIPNPDELLPTLTSIDGQVWSNFPGTIKNPRFKAELGYNYWWNKPFWDAIDEDEMKYLLRKKGCLEERILEVILGYQYVNLDRPKYLDKKRCTEQTIDIIAQNLKVNKVFINDYGKHYAKYKQQLEWYEKTSKERNKQLWKEE